MKSNIKPFIRSPLLRLAELYHRIWLKPSIFFTFHQGPWYTLIGFIPGFNSNDTNLMFSLNLGITQKWLSTKNEFSIQLSWFRSIHILCLVVPCETFHFWSTCENRSYLYFGFLLYMWENNSQTSCFNCILRLSIISYLWKSLHRLLQELFSYMTTSIVCPILRIWNFEEGFRFSTLRFLCY